MKTPFHRFFAPVVSESPIEGATVASGAATPSLTPSTEVGEQTEMMTRLRRRTRMHSSEADAPRTGVAKQ